MIFINRTEDRKFLQEQFQKNLHQNQIYIIEANQGVGKSAFINEISKTLELETLTVPLIEEKITNQQAFKRLVIEVDKNSKRLNIQSYQDFYNNKNNINKFGKIFEKIFSSGLSILSQSQFGRPINVSKLFPNMKEYDSFILKANSEQLFFYVSNALKEKNICIIFEKGESIDASSADLIGQLIQKLNNNIYFFEYNVDSKHPLQLENFLKNDNSKLISYPLHKLDPEHIKEYIENQLDFYGLKGAHINLSNLSNLQEPIRSGNLVELLNSIKEYAFQVKEKHEIELLSVKQILLSLSKSDLFVLYLLTYSKNNLLPEELLQLTNNANIFCKLDNLKQLQKRGLVVIEDNYIYITPNVSYTLKKYDINFVISESVISSLNMFLRISLKKRLLPRYVDILVDLYIEQKWYEELATIGQLLEQRLLDFNSQLDRIQYFQKFIDNKEKFLDDDFIIRLVEIAYESNLYHQALLLLNMLQFRSPKTDRYVWLQAIVLNRCESFHESEKFILEKITDFKFDSEIFFNLSLVRMMNLIQLNKKEEATKIFKVVDSQHNYYKNYVNYSCFLRLSNLFYNKIDERLTIVQKAIHLSLKLDNKVLIGLNYIYLCYLHILNKNYSSAEEALSNARNYLTQSSVYNHMILHNEAVIRFKKNEISDDIRFFLENAKLTAYDNYDRLAIDNNLLIYYILKSQTATYNCQIIVEELERLLNEIEFERFKDVVYYNLYFFYKSTYKETKSKKYKEKISSTGNLEVFQQRLMYETSWKIPLKL